MRRPSPRRTAPDPRPLAIIIGSYGPSLINFRGPLIAALLASGRRVLAVAPDLSPEISAELARLGAASMTAPMDRRGLNPLRDLATLAVLWRLFRATKAEIVIAYTVKPVVYGGLAARLAGVPRFAPIITGLGFSFSEEGGSAATGLLRRAARGLYRLSLAGAAHVFFQNEDDLAEFRTRGLLPAHIRATVTAGSGVDIGKFAFVAPRDRKSASARPLRFLMLSRLLHEKGVVEFVEAAGEVRRRGLEASFRLVGPHDPGPDAIPAETVEAWRRDGAVEILPAVDDVRPELAAADVFVLPSYREGRPRAAMEALAVGRPLILTDVPGCRQTVIPGETGLLVPAREVAPLADAMEAFIRNPERVCDWGIAARRDAETRFAVTRVNAAILAALGPPGEEPVGRGR